MKKTTILLCLMGTLLSCKVVGQVKEHYTISGGLLGAFNYSNLRVGDNNGFVESGDWKPGFAGGIWFNFPLGKIVSIEPQLQYSKVGGEIKTPSPSGNLDQNLGYLSSPILLKFSSKSIALFVGPQFDFLLSAKNKNTDSDNKDAFTSNDIGITGGIELFPHGPVAVYAKYTHGFSNINDLSSPEYFNQGMQVGIKFKLFGKFIPGDKDGDGVIDADDKCPTEPGFERYGGCPIPDSDADGLNDEADKCPTVAGLTRYDGCPIPDTDGDGLNDEEDKCPNKAGVPELKGCPKPDYKAHGVTFAPGKAVLTKAGENELDHLYDFLNENPTIGIKLVGYTDSTGTAKVNDPLSLARAESSKAYLVSKGIADSRISTEGRGAANPIADNKTKEGRELNRRIEIEVE